MKNPQAVDCLKSLKGKVLIVASEKFYGVALLYANLLNLKNGCLTDVEYVGSNNQSNESKFNNVLLFDATSNNAKAIDFSKHFSSLHDYVHTALSFYLNDESSVQSVENLKTNTKLAISPNKTNVFVCDDTFSPAFDLLKRNLSVGGKYQLLNVSKFEFLNRKVVLPKDANIVFVEGKDKHLDKICLDAMKNVEFQKIQSTKFDAFVDSCAFFLWAVNVCGA